MSPYIACNYENSSIEVHNPEKYLVWLLNLDICLTIIKHFSCLPLYLALTICCSVPDLTTQEAFVLLSRKENNLGESHHRENTAELALREAGKKKDSTSVA